MNFKRHPLIYHNHKMTDNQSPQLTKHQSQIQFWKKYKEECKQIRTVKQVFQTYKEWCETNNHPIQNEYRFRTFIRNNGYNNGRI